MTRAKLTKIIIPVMAGLCLASCNSGNNRAPNPTKAAKPADAVDTKPVAETAMPPTTELSTEEALLKRGRIVWFKCRSCHETSAEGPHKVGPNLHGMIGAEAGVKEGFVYSDAMKNSEIVWDEETLDAFIEKPATYVKGTKMAFVGIRKESDRQALIAYVKENAKPSK